MNIRHLISFAFFMATLSACANSSEPTTKSQFIVGFINAESQSEATANKAETLKHWQNITAVQIHYVRNLGKQSWVISAAPEDNQTFMSRLQALDTIKYVEEDQKIQISPIERPSKPVRVY